MKRMPELDWKIVAVDGYPENNGSGYSDVCVVFSIDMSCDIGRRVFEEDDGGKDFSHWEGLPESRQHRPKIWAYLPEPPQEVFDKAIAAMKSERLRKSANAKYFCSDLRCPNREALNLTAA